MKQKLTVEITITQKCNMACTYCFEGDELKNTTKQSTEKDIIKSLKDMLLDERFLEKFDGYHISFWGGEASIDYELCNRLMNAFKDDNVTFFFYTNGYSVFNLDKIITFYQKEISTEFNRLSFQISYDGKYNDLSRIDHSGKGTSDNILKTIRYLNKTYPDLQTTLKSTILPSQLKDISIIWDEFKNLCHEMESKFLLYSPTIEYTNTYNFSKDELELIENEFLKIAQKEIEHYNEFGFFILSWFNVKNRSICSAGSGLINIDLNGDILVCHGALYSENKKDLTNGNIKDKDFIDKFLVSQSEYSKGYIDTINVNILKEQDDICKQCSATVCNQCPTVNYDRFYNSDLSKNEKYYTKTFDMCDIYNSFGKISQVVNQTVNKEINKE